MSKIRLIKCQGHLSGHGIFLTFISPNSLSPLDNLLFTFIMNYAPFIIPHVMTLMIYSYNPSQLSMSSNAI